MVNKPNTQSVGLLISGGLDSTILLFHLLEMNFHVHPFYIRSGLIWEEEERESLKRLLAYSARAELKPLVTLDIPLKDLYQKHWSMTGNHTPDASSPDEAVYLPGRNALLILKAAIWCQMEGVDRLALAPLKHNPFSDASDEFFESLERTLFLAIQKPLRIWRPFSHRTKHQVMNLGRKYPLELTFSCISPRDGMHCGECNKCGERKKAFQQSEISDSTSYAPNSLK